MSLESSQEMESTWRGESAPLGPFVTIAPLEALESFEAASWDRCDQQSWSTISPET
jgi:hypothetical protein